MIRADTIARIERYIEAHMPVRVESLLADGHVFWWDTRPLAETDFVLINRNGNLNRGVRYDSSGRWALYRGMGNSQDGPFVLEGPPENVKDTLSEIVQLSWLPDRDRETLSFLPKLLTDGTRRQMICRTQLFRFIGIGGDGFKLAEPGTIHESPRFEGQPWKSAEAFEWALQRVEPLDAPTSAEGDLVLAKAALVEAAAEDTVPGWGMF